MTIQRPKRTRMIDIAREAGVSLTTVGQVLLKSGGKNVRVSKATSELVQRVAKDLNYQPNHIARQLAGKKSQIIGVFIDPDAAPQSNKRLAEIELLIQKHGYRLMIGHPMNNAEQTAQYVDDFLARGVEGLICIHHAYPGHEELVPKLVQKITNVVFIQKPAIENACYIEIDELNSTCEIVEYLWRKGARKIGLALTDKKWPGNRQRIEGYRKGLKQIETSEAEAIWLGESQLVQDPHHISPEEADKIIDELVKTERVDAIIAMNDYWAARLVLRLKKHGYRVPEDIKVVGYDNLDIGTYMEPELTTMAPPYKDIAHSATKMLFELIEKGGIAEEDRGVTVKPTLLVRGSA